MAETTYTYNITNDLPDGKVNSGNLHVEIVASSIATTLKSVNTDGGTYSYGVITGGTLKIIFTDALSAGDKTILDGDTTAPAGGLLAANTIAEETKSTLLSAVDTISTTSSTFVSIPSMATTPDAGTYIVTFSGSMENDSRSKSIEVAIYANDVEVGHSKRKFIRGNQQQVAPFTCIAKVAVNGSQTIEGRWKVQSGSSGTISERSLLLTPE
jgi:hypothetical protein